MAQNNAVGTATAQLPAVELVQTLFDAFSRGDIPYILGCLTADCRWIAPGQGLVPASGEHIGPSGTAQFFQTLNETEQITLFEPREFFQKADDVVVLGAEEMRVLKNGNRAKTNWAMLFRLRDGKVSQWEIFFDTAAYARAHQETQ